MSIVNLADFPDYPRLLRGRLPSRRSNVKSGAPERAKMPSAPAANTMRAPNNAAAPAHCVLPLAE